MIERTGHAIKDLNTLFTPGFWLLSGLALLEERFFSISEIAKSTQINGYEKVKFSCALPQIVLKSRRLHFFQSARL